MSSTSDPLRNLAKTHLLGIWVETLLFGINCVLFVGAIYTMRARKNLRVPIPLTIATILTFSLALSHVALSVVELLEAFTKQATLETHEGPDRYFADPSNPVYVAKGIIYTFDVFCQDLLLLWRLYVIWYTKWYLCIPLFIMAMVYTAAGSVATFIFLKSGITVFSPVVQKWGLASWSLQIATNAILTGAIAGRLWWLHRLIPGRALAGSLYQRSIIRVVESGGIFFVGSLVFFICDLSHSPVGPVGISTVVTQLATMSPLLLIVRVNMDLIKGRNYTSMSKLETATSSGRPSYKNPIRVNVTNTTFDDDNSEIPMGTFQTHEEKPNAV